MASTKVSNRQHRHRSVVTLVITQRAGVPYELERIMCATCGQELGRRELRRALGA